MLFVAWKAVGRLCLHPQARPGPGVGSLVKSHGILGLLPRTRYTYWTQTNYPIPRHIRGKNATGLPHDSFGRCWHLTARLTIVCSLISNCQGDYGSTRHFVS